MNLFADAGYAPVAPGWPGVPAIVQLARASPGSITGYGIDDVTAHYAAELPRIAALVDEGGCGRL